MRKLIFGFIWFVVLYFGACAVTGGIAGGLATSKLPAETSQAWANEVAMAAATEMVLELRAYFFVGALVIVVVGSILGILPGTRSAAAQAARYSALDAGVQPVDAPTGLTQTGDLYRRRREGN